MVITTYITIMTFQLRITRQTHRDHVASKSKNIQNNPEINGTTLQTP